MKIILINPTRREAPSFGLLYLAAVLEKNHDVKVFEFEEPFKIDSTLFKDIESFSPDIVGITVMSYQIGQAKAIINKLLRYLPEAVFVAGGRHATTLPNELLEMGFHFVVLGEAEESFPELLIAIEEGKKLRNIKGIVFKEGKQIINTGIREPPDVNKLPWPAYHLVDMKHYLLSVYGFRGKWMKTGWVFTSRGCPGRCTFCYNNAFFANRLRHRDLDNIIEEIKFLKRQYNIKALWIVDDTFTLSESNVKEFCDRIKKENFGLKLNAQTRVNTFTEEMAKNMKEAGFEQVEFGVESGSQKVLDGYRKGITVEQTKKAFKITHKYGFTTFANFMIGAPNEKKEDIEMTKKLIKEIKSTTIGCSFLTAYPGTVLYDESIKNGWLKDDTYFLQTYDKPQMTINFSEEELIKIRNEIYSLNMGKTVLLFLKDFNFWKDMIKISIKNPDFPFRVMFNLLKGDSSTAINIFKQKMLE